MSSRMTPNLNPKTLDDLLANAQHYAEYCMRGNGSMGQTSQAKTTPHLSIGGRSRQHYFSDLARRPIRWPFQP